MRRVSRVFLSVFLLSCFFVPPLSAQEDSSVLEDLQRTAAELSSQPASSRSGSQSSSQSSTPESPSASGSSRSLTQSELESMNPFQLLDVLQESLESSEARLSEIMRSSRSLEEDLVNTRLELESSKASLKALKEALLSNKDDTGVAIAEIGRLSEQIRDLDELASYYRKRARSSAIAANILIPVCTVPMVITGAVLAAGGNDLGQPVLYTGLGLLVGCELVYNSGRLVFRWW